MIHYNPIQQPTHIITRGYITYRNTRFKTCVTQGDFSKRVLHTFSQHTFSLGFGSKDTGRQQTNVTERHGTGRNSTTRDQHGAARDGKKRNATTNGKERLHTRPGYAHLPTTSRDARPRLDTTYMCACVHMRMCIFVCACICKTHKTNKTIAENKQKSRKK